MNSAVSAVKIYEGGAVFNKTVYAYQTAGVDTYDMDAMSAIQWLIHIKAQNKFLGFQVYSIKKNTVFESTMFGILGDEDLDIQVQVVQSGTNAVLQIINNEPYNLVVKGKRINI